MEKALFLKGGEAELLSRVLELVKSTTFEKSQKMLNDLEALEVLASYFERAGKVEPEKEARQKPIDSLGKRLFLGHVIGRDGYTDTASGSGP